MIAANLGSPISAPSLFSLFVTKRKKLTPLFSCSSALFKKECLPNPFAIKAFRTLLQNTGGGTPPARTLPASFSPSIPNSFTTLRLRAVLARRIRTSTKHTRNPFRIRTSKTQDLKPFRMNTYEKKGRGDPGHTNGTDFRLSSSSPTHILGKVRRGAQLAVNGGNKSGPAAFPVVRRRGNSQSAKFVRIILAVHNVPLFASFEDLFLLRSDFLADFQVG